MMVDAGDICGSTPYLSDPLPSGQHRPGEWIGGYAKRRFDVSELTSIDTFLLMHLHGDHVGYLPPDGSLSSDGTYRLTSVSDVAAIIPIQKFWIAHDRITPIRAWSSFCQAGLSLLRCVRDGSQVGGQSRPSSARLA